MYPRVLHRPALPGSDSNWWLHSKSRAFETEVLLDRRNPSAAVHVCEAVMPAPS